MQKQNEEPDPKMTRPATLPKHTLSFIIGTVHISFISQTPDIQLGRISTYKDYRYHSSSVADPDLYPSRIPDPKTATKNRGEKKIVVIPFDVATNLTKIILKCGRKKFGPNFIEL